MSMQAALATVLVNDQARRELRTHPAILQQRFALTDEELALLLSVDPARLELTTQIGRAKRLDFLKRGIPATIDMLCLFGKANLLSEFVRGCPDIVGTENSRILVESRRFRQYLDSTAADAVIAAVRSLVALELARLELLNSNEAALWLRQTTSTEEFRSRLQHDREFVIAGWLRLGRNVRVEAFQHDVLELFNAVRAGVQPDLSNNPIHLTLVRCLRRPWITLHRTGSELAAMLLFCMQPRPVTEVLALANSYDEQRRINALRQALLEGILLFTDKNPDGNDAANNSLCESVR